MRVNGVGFSYSSVPVLDDIWLDLDGPQLVSVLGPNGVGKSTLINCMCKILSPSRGAILVGGRDVAGIPPKEMAKIMGYVPYSSGSSFPMNVVDAVLMGRHPYSKWKTDDEDIRKVYDALCRLEIEHLAMRQFNELSAGQHQKVVLARGLVQEPEILLLDEPTSNLDIRHQMDVTKLLRSLSREKNMLTVMISHDINIAAKYSDNIILMYRGGIYAAGSPWDVITEENIGRVYGVDCTIIDSGGRPHVILNHSVKYSEDDWKSDLSEETMPRLSPADDGVSDD
ncbi:MAG: ABC transporter ATP-binding protein [Candidatus Methanomethylophilaceae archaeon]|nr:ABC transporter ATP-binding protein [Candidatus Methanomethylophilaceae archaeon]